MPGALSEMIISFLVFSDKFGPAKRGKEGVLTLYIYIYIKRKRGREPRVLEHRSIPPPPPPPLDTQQAATHFLRESSSKQP